MASGKSCCCCCPACVMDPCECLFDMLTSLTSYIYFVPLVSFSHHAKGPRRRMVVRELDNHPASVAARQLVARMKPWTKHSERRYRWQLALVGAFPAARRRLEANRAARKLGFCPNKEAMDLMYNCIHPSSLDALSAEQRSEDSSEVDPRLMDDAIIADWQAFLRILPFPLWSMGKSFRIDNRQKRCIVR